MQRNKAITSLIVILTISLVFVPLTPTQDYKDGFQLESVEHIQIAQVSGDPVLLEDIKQAISVTSIPGQILEGLNLFTVVVFSRDDLVTEAGYVLITDMAGNIVNGFVIPGEAPDVELIDSDTAMIHGKGPDGFTKTVYFWNWKTNATQFFSVPTDWHSHHDIEYNPVTETFLVLERYDVDEYNGDPILQDRIVEYNKISQVVWEWNVWDHVPFNSTEYDIRGETWGNHADWSHSNTIFWEYEHDLVYLNIRNLDTFYKIDYSSGDIIWSLGRLGDFTLYDINGVKRDTLWYHSHSLERIGPNRFILYDNDFQNTTSDNPILTGTSRMLELVINETTMTANVTWKWEAPDSYYCTAWGDADRLPDGNTLGTFAWVWHDAYLTEVNQAGEKVWEMQIRFTNDHRFGVYRMERFYEQPIVEFVRSDSIIEAGISANVTLKTWNTLRTREPYPGKVQVWEENTLLREMDFSFMPHWQETEVTVDIPMLNGGLHNLDVILVNNDDIASEAINVEVEVVGELPTEPEPESGPVLLYAGIAASAIVVIVILMRRD
ncbi:MAG: aryl-sulfate sulfotransferase [Candidatus Thorarchaeota archaeon]